MVGITGPLVERSRHTTGIGKEVLVSHAKETNTEERKKTEGGMSYINRLMHRNGRSATPSVHLLLSTQRDHSERSINGIHVLSPRFLGDKIPF